jgi:hypothetical protein
MTSSLYSCVTSETESSLKRLDIQFFVQRGQICKYLLQSNQHFEVNNYNKRHHSTSALLPILQYDLPKVYTSLRDRIIPDQCKMLVNIV